MGNKTGRQKSQEQGEGEDDTNKQADDTLNTMDDQSAEKQETSTKVADEQTGDGERKENETDKVDPLKPTEDTTTVNNKEGEQIPEEVQKNLVEQKDSELKEQTSAGQIKTDLTETKHIDSREKDEDHDIVSSSIKKQEKMSEENEASFEQKEQSDSVAKCSKDELSKAEVEQSIAFEQEQFDEGKIEPVVQEEQQVAEITKKSESVPQLEEKLSKEIPSEEASSEQKEEPESCEEVGKDEVPKTAEGHAVASEQVNYKDDQLEPDVQEQEQVAEIIRKSETVQEETLSEDIHPQKVTSEQKEQLESLGEVTKDEVLKADKRHTETPEQVKGEDDQPEPEVQEQEQVAESTKKCETVLQQEENVSMEIPAEQPEPFGEVSKNEVLKSVEGHAGALEQLKGEDDQPETESQKEEEVSEEILPKEEASHAQEEHTMAANTSSEEVDRESEKVEEEARENADVQPDKAGGKEEGELATEGNLEGLTSTDREQPVKIEFRWEEGGEKVLVSGSFGDWNDPVELKKNQS
ncbi:hypothetical protein ACJMK2_036856 [Sinanodonta woodiana]|uniref:AMP-activated protein kinase glycogen-binding domain-containing protein n=1 Tax=Sinanodonta woodiana TaxID=1069815 RepID=A0ABD3WKL4_SINWO